MRAIFWLGALGCVACGATERSASEATSGAGGQVTVQAGSSAQSGGGAAGPSSGASAGGAGSSADAAAGNTAVGGALAKPCGGDVTGSWVSVVPAAPKSHPSNVDACFNMAFTRGSDGSLQSNGRFWVDVHATPVTTNLKFNPPLMGPSTYSFAETYRGTVVQDYAAACLADGQGQATCAELSSLLTTIGIGEGSFPSVVCMPGPSDGCSCAIQVQETGGGAGQWSVDAKDPTTLVLATPSPTQFEMYDSFNVPYCADASGLHFGAELEQAWPRIPTHSFVKLDCADGKQGPGEDGVDCGYVCGTDCR